MSAREGKKMLPMNDLRRRSAFALGLLIFAVLAAGCGDKGKLRDRPVYTQPATTMMPLNHPLIETLGKLEGPYRIGSAVSPIAVSLIDSTGKTELFMLLGLRADEYPPDQAPADAESQATRDAEIEARPQLYAFKSKALADLFGNDAVWVLRMNSQAPAIAYIFKPEKPPLKADEQPTGPGQLLNAEALRRGLATMDLDGVDFPFYKMMYDAQLAAIVDARAKPLDQTSIWNAFHLRVPEDLEPDVKAMAGKL